MSKFGKIKPPEGQAESAFKLLLRTKAVPSRGSLRNYKERLTQVAKNMPIYNIKGDIYDLSRETAAQYLEIRSQEIGQKTLDMERQALQVFMRANEVLESTEKLPVIKSEQVQVLVSRAYTIEQVSMISNAQTAKFSLSTEIAHAAGLRAHEILTIRPVADQPADERPALDSKWIGREGDIYTVTGKGGLTREVLIPGEIASRLEDTKLDSPRLVTDRQVHYRQHYNIGGGKAWSNSFSGATKRVLGWSQGGHGVRHSYAQERMDEVQQSLLDSGVKNDLVRDAALETTSQEMGHFRPEITETYLR